MSNVNLSLEKYIILKFNTKFLFSYKSPPFKVPTKMDVYQIKTYGVAHSHFKFLD